MKRLAMAFLLATAACRRGHPTSVDGGPPLSAAERGPKLESFISELLAISGSPPGASPMLPSSVGITPGNTLVLAGYELALLRKEPARSTAHAPARLPLTEMLVEARGGAVHNRLFLTDPARDTAFATMDKLAYFAIVEEEAWITETSIQSVAIWDRAAKKWVGTLQVALPLTEAPDKEMAQFVGGKQSGPSFTVGEKPEEREKRHRHEVDQIVVKALTKRKEQWAEQSGVDSPTAFRPDNERTYTVPLPSDSPSLGRADAKVVVQVFTPHGDGGTVLLIHRIAQAYGDRVRIVWRDRMTADNTAAANAAREVLSAKGTVAFWSYVDRLCTPTSAFRSLTVDDLVREAVALGAAPERVRNAIKGNLYRKAIEADGAALRAARLPTRPTLATFTNGWTLSNSSFHLHAARIDAALGSTR